MTELKKKKTPRDLLRIVFRRRYVFFLGAALFMVGALIWGHYMPLKYRGETIFERRNDEAAPAGTSDVASFEDQKRTLYFELAGYRAVEQAAEELKLVKAPRTEDDLKLTPQGELIKQQLVNELRKTVQVQFRVRSEAVDLITVSFIHEDPKLAEQMPNQLVKNYINAVTQLIINRLIQSKSFLEKQVAAGRDELAQLRDLKAKFELEHANMMFDTPSAIQEQSLITSTRIEVLRGQQRMIENRLPELEQAVADYEASLTAETQPFRQVLVLNEEREQSIKQLEDMKERLLIALESMKEAHPTIIAFRKQIQRLEEKIAKMPEKKVVEEEIRIEELPDRRDEYEKAKYDLSVVVRTIKGLEDRLKALDQALANFGPARREYELMLERIQEKENAVSEWNDRLRSVGAALAAELADKRTHLTTWQAAQRQIRPYSPSLTKVLLVAVFGGLAFGAALVFLANLLDRSISTTEDASRTFPIPIHGVIGEILSSSRKAGRTMRRWLVTPLISLLVIATVATCILSIVLYLDEPAKHKEWKAAPVEYVVDSVKEMIQ